MRTRTTIVLMALALTVAVVLSSATLGVGAPASSVPAAPSSATLALGAPTIPTDQTKVPHYFGPYSNWANSPQVLADATVAISLGTPTPVSFGNPLVGRAFATDFATAPATLGPVFVVLPNASLPAGTLQSFQIWNQTVLGGSPNPSAGNLFHAYVLRPTGSANQYTVVFDSGELTVPVPTNPGGEVATFTVSPVAVQAGDVIGFYGEGIPVDTGVATNPDTFSYLATTNPDLVTPAAPTAPSTITLGLDPGFPIFMTQDRTYSFSASVTPTVADPGTGATATATVDPKTGAISAVTVTSPGAGYLVAPTVSITSGVTPTTPASATAVISTGVVTSIAVNEWGFGFSAPAVTITGGNPTPGFEATAVASGGVDNLTLTSGGSGYTAQPIVEFSLPNLPGGVQATGTATMSAGVVDGVTLVNPGSGYTSAPTITIKDAGQTPLADPAVAEATIGIGQIDVTSGGQGYDSAPTVAINDTVGTPDKGASATAMVAVKGAVTAINVTNPGAGYLTPGLKKFVDTLPGLGPTAANDLGQYIPVAVADTTTYPGVDYYEIGVVQYRMKFHRDLPATLLRGYVQLSTSVVPGKRVPLTNANLVPAVVAAPALLPDGTQALGVDNPHYLGPTIVANKDRPVRILFRNLLPTGDDGNLFLPVDTSLMGAGMGPDMVELDANNVPKDMALDEGSVLDTVRNPVCGEIPKPLACFNENRATLHLHGGITPWISDGTPHQWITPAGDNTAYPQGVSVSNVPDMPDPGPGAQTFFYTNQQSARLMFYHDHAWGITRLNVYAGEAAGYLVTDAMEQALIGAGGALEGLGVGTPLVIQDKTFVSKGVAKLNPDGTPNTADPLNPTKNTDPTWDAARWGGEGSLWLPHVYMPAQNPGDPSGMSAFGRWMYGPWFWPPAKDAKYPPIANPYYDPTCDPNVQPFCEPALIPSTPNISVGMEAFNDTPVVNGTAYPTTTVDPKAYRYRILNAANDRFWNLQWYVADPTTGTLSEVALNPAEVAAAQTDPVVFPTPDTTLSPAGPNWIQLGTEGGFLPDPVVVPAQPTTWITDPTRFDVGNVDQHSLLLAPAERADVIVDFSQFRGKTLILYNDAPAAFPARVSSYDYYTGGPDLSPVGAPTTLPGYGPNTRTIMQVKVSNAAPALAWDRPNTTADRMGTLVAEFKHHLDPVTHEPAGVFESSVDPIIVGQAAYNTAYGTDFVASGWCNGPGVDPLSPAFTKCDGYARIAEGSQPTDVFGFNGLDSAFAPGTAFTPETPSTPGTGKLQIPFQPKGMHDEMNSASFDEWGRMTANLGLEAPGATPLLQNIILYPYVNPATEILDATLGLPSSLDVTPISSSADGTQIWKITHNGVDTHPIHFHLYDVQVINRVTWDNIIIPPEPTELGWKDTVRVSPLEDTIVAMRPIVPAIPFGVPDSRRPLNPMMPEGARGSAPGVVGTEAGFNNTDTKGNPMTPIINEVVSFGWEYVFHCHILSHEEMDMMRPVTVKVASAAPDAPVLSFARGSVILNWTDGTPVVYADPTTWANPKNEVGYRIERADADAAGILTGDYAEIGTALANTTTYTDTPPNPATQAYSYRVIAYNQAGGSTSAPLTVPPGGPTTTTLTSSLNPSVFGDSVTFTATVSPAAATGTVTFNIDGVVVGTPQTVVGGVAAYTISSLAVGSHPVTATYSGDLAYLGSTGTITQTVSQMATTTVVAGIPNPSYVGDNVIFTATVSPAAATGTVTFNIDGVDVGTPQTVVGGMATYATAALVAGEHLVTATYNGDLNYSASTSLTITQTVGKMATTTAVTSSLNPSFVGDNVIFTATVSPAAGTGVPTGTVQFSVDGVAVGGALPLDATGKATYSTATLTVGDHRVEAVYIGDAAYLPGVSGPLFMQTVNRKTTATAVTSSLNPSYVGDNVIFTATVSPAAATGTVTFSIDGTTVASPTLVGGVATYATATLAAGPHSVTATYNGDTVYQSSTSATLTQTVNPLRATSTVVTSNRVPTANLGQSITFTARVAPVTGTGVPTGTVQFSIDGVNVGGLRALSATGTATYSTATLLAGSHNVIAVYNGSAIFAASTSPTFTQVVNGPPAAPSNLVAVATRNGTRDTVTLTWVDNATNETGFTVQRAQNAAFTNRLTTYTVAANATTLVQTGVTRNISYYYRIRARNAAGNSAWVNATPFPVRTP